MDHFQETANCQIVDACGDSNIDSSNGQQQLDPDTANNNRSSITQLLVSSQEQETAPRSLRSNDDNDNDDDTTAISITYDISEYEILDGPSIMRCDRWRPSEEEPGSCTNRIMPGEVWPTSMYRKTHFECCSDFFKLESCSVVDVCETR